MTPLLSLRHISKSFPGVKALQDVSLDVHAGEVHALLGENGAGKSTLMKILCGIYRQDEGDIIIDGKTCDFHGYQDALNAGVGIIFQEFSLIPDLDAVDNIFLGRELRNRLGLRDRPGMIREAQRLFDRLKVSIPMDCPIAELSVADQQFIEIAKALSLDARILVLDEPTATLTPSEADHLFTIMRELREQQVGMVFISHHMEEIFTICDRVTVMRDGEKVDDCDIVSTTPDDLIEKMVGRRVENIFPEHRCDADYHDVVLDIEALRLDTNGPEHSLKLHRGEILGFAGLVGSGRTELAMGLIGATRPAHAKVSMEGKPVKLRHPATALKLGIGLLPESRKTQGLILPFSCRDNISLNNLTQFQGALPLIRRGQESRTAAELMASVRVKAPSPETPVGDLSGGNQQKVVIARWLGHQCKVLIFDEPTRGIDVGAKSEIYALMKELTAQGVSIIMISSELPEVLGLCDRAAVFYHGRIAAELQGEDLNSQSIMHHATGGLSS
ncbi:ribonucleotide-diphosphate reductase subunit alpha [Litchfieldella anticariensis FP35 = DSM 16096]|uniref:Ribonucleotide-diphosphate reductase subunit alpha n=1 Tax=Litchfieldella anticariensis (strain DSM 16096 / CECT 5854 / CIP 108499 / LMG 22089 / FP35) TaxID=1121939 RepID=S2KK00_LITA3|nr:sugar ABC transporter ATP-binding protein [Halomonas anticariensis]EPC02285.1 ribonucleotide-diphosphate reductase subunit alpha [Halomonas anticariensis FP35 = DSM 16096]